VRKKVVVRPPARRQHRPAAGLHRRGCLPFLDGLDTKACKRLHHENVFHHGIVLIAAAPCPPSRTIAPVGGPFHPPFIATLSNNTPLAFGMDEETAAARSHPAQLRQRPPGEEILPDVPHIGGSGLFYKKDRLYLQFRKAGCRWKGRLGHNWMWQ